MTINPLYHLFFPKSREVSQAKLNELKKKAEELKKEKEKTQKILDDAKKAVAAAKAQQNLYNSTSERYQAARRRIDFENERRALTEQRKKDEAMARAKRIVEYNEKVYREELAKQGLLNQRKSKTNDYKTFNEAFTDVEKYNSPDYGTVYVCLTNGYQYAKDNIKIPEKGSSTDVTFDIEAGVTVNRMKMVRNVDGKVVLDQPYAYQYYGASGTFTVSITSS